MAKSVFYMKAKDLTDNGDGTTDWGGVKVEVEMQSGTVTQDEALTRLGKSRLLEILQLGFMDDDDIEFISQEEYERDYGDEE